MSEAEATYAQAKLLGASPGTLMLLGLSSEGMRRAADSMATLYAEIATEQGENHA